MDADELADLWLALNMKDVHPVELEADVMNELAKTLSAERNMLWLDDLMFEYWDRVEVLEDGRELDLRYYRLTAASPYHAGERLYTTSTASRGLVNDADVDVETFTFTMCYRQALDEVSARPPISKIDFPGPEELGH